MEIVHNLNNNKSFSLNTVHGDKNVSDTLRENEKELLHQMAEAFTVVTGGQFKRRRQIA
jgi:hypothetical protein